VTVRPLNHTGAGQDERFVLPSFAAQIARIEAGVLAPNLRVGNVDVERDFLDVRDVIDAYLLILAQAESLPRRTLFNIASGQPRRIAELLDMMVKASTRRQQLGWAPKRSVNDLVGGLLAYWRARTSGENDGP
jgi:GDP-4-dehydro-6-deoxy-D-mannose reductase